MVDGGNRKDDSIPINSTNVFAALGSLRKKKKSDKEQGSSNKSSGSKKKQDKEGKAEKEQVFWAPAPLKVKSWDDEDDDDYCATTAPPHVWGGAGEQQDKVKGSETPVEVAFEEKDKKRALEYWDWINVVDIDNGLEEDELEQFWKNHSLITCLRGR